MLIYYEFGNESLGIYLLSLHQLYGSSICQILFVLLSSGLSKTLTFNILVVESMM